MSPTDEAIRAALKPWALALTEDGWDEIVNDVQRAVYPVIRAEAIADVVASLGRFRGEVTLHAVADFIEQEFGGAA
jgi:hypothetical protein